MSKIVLEVRDCQDCPFVKSEYVYTGDSWDHMYDYFCQKADNKKVAGAIEWRSEMPEVPEWCPCHLQKEISRFASNAGMHIAGHSNYHGDHILTALYCAAEGKEIHDVEPLE